MLPTFIYWLIDTRPETIEAGWHSGYPFYCGKTINEPEKRLAAHRALAYKKPNRKVARRLISCGRHVRIEVVKIVPAGGDWQEQERSSIRTLRFSFPDNCNTAEGGLGGLTGYEMTRSQREAHLRAVRASDRCVKARLRREEKARHEEQQVFRKDKSGKNKRVLVPRNINYVLR